MKTQIIKIDKYNIDLDKLKYAGDVLKNGGLVAFPTETVYGLGANALNSAAVENIFKAKGRPSDNPLIVHIHNKDKVIELTKQYSEVATKLMNKFWPGPLTIVLERNDIIPDIVTAGLNTLGIRIPNHPVALELLRLSNVPIAAPSANKSGKPSPTNADRVIEDLMGLVDVIVDAGGCDIGVESTVLDLTQEIPMILRPGGVTIEQLKKIIKNVEYDPAIIACGYNVNKPKAPGMKYTHYSPKADLKIISGDSIKVIEKINELTKNALHAGKRVGILSCDETKKLYDNATVFSVGSKNNSENIASNLFEMLRKFDDLNIEIIFSEAFDVEGIGMAIMNRMNKAAGYNIIYV